MSYNDHHNDHCEIAADMLGTDPGLLDYRLVRRLNAVAALTPLTDKQVIATIIVNWRESVADDFTKQT